MKPSKSFLELKEFSGSGLIISAAGLGKESPGKSMKYRKSGKSREVRESNDLLRLSQTSLDFPDFKSILPFQPRFRHRDDTDIHRAIIFGKHGGLDLDFSAVGAHRRVRMIGGRRFMSGR